jgi:hypothetical protein
MAIDGQFPKINGDVLYASEVNRFSTLGTILGIGSTGFVGSATAMQTVGSVVCSGISANMAFIDVAYIAGKDAGGVQSLASQLTFSGTVLLGSCSIYTDSGYDGAYISTSKLVLKSVGSGFVTTIAYPIGGLYSDNNSGNIGTMKSSSKMTGFGNINIGSPFAIFFQLRTTSNANIPYYQVSTIYA